MKKRFTVITAILLCFVMMFTFASCSGTQEDEGEEFKGATIDVGDAIPVSEAEIIAFYNDIITKVQLADTFTAENKPGLKTDESLHVDNISVLKYDVATATATEDGSLEALNKSAKALKEALEQ